jgi:hypothetical protein
MPNEPVNLNTFAVALLEAAHRTLKQATDDITDEQLFHQPTPETNSMGWLAWHLSRWKDHFAADAVGEDQVWVSQGWAVRFDMDSDRTGQGDTLEQVAAFKPSRELLFGYIEAAQEAVVDRVGRISGDRFEEPSQYAPGGQERPVWRSLVGTTMDFAQHTGQIAYVRGLVTGYGWRPF